MFCLQLHSATISQITMREQALCHITSAKALSITIPIALAKRLILGLKVTQDCYTCWRFEAFFQSSLSRLGH